MSKQHLTAPVPTSSLPKGIPYIIGNEAAERFSFYGMKSILVVFMHQYLHLMDGQTGIPVMAKAAAIEQYHDFTSWVYLTPLLGALLADSFLGKYRTILSLSMVYCLGHLALAFMGVGGLSAEGWLMTGLALIAFGSGGIKPCVSAHVGDQFGKSNGHWLSKVFGWFYISINVGAFLSTLSTPLLLEYYGPHWAFGVPGVLMAIATFVFWMGRDVFVHIPPSGSGFFRETFSVEGLLVLLKLGMVFIFVAVFWALFDQTGSSWVLQAEDLNRNWLGFDWLSSQIQAINPIMIVTFVPIFNGIETLRWPGLYSLISKVFPLTPLRKVGLGLFLMVFGFAMVAVLQSWIDAGEYPSIGWQVLAYAVLTASEVMVSITCLEFAYTQAPKEMKSMVMALFLMSVSLGNFFTAGVNSVIQVPSPAVVAGSVAEARGGLPETLPANDEASVKAWMTTIASGHGLQDGEWTLSGFTKGEEDSATAGFTMTLHGADGKLGGDDDLPIAFDAGGFTIQLSQEAALEQAAGLIKKQFNANEETLPTTTVGQELLGELKDQWASPIQYRLVNRNSFRVTSLGTDKTYMTPVDQVLQVFISRPAVGDDSGVEKPLTWREQQIVDLYGDEGRATVTKERGGVPTLEMDQTLQMGGQTNLEGSDYFWFFTYVMFGTAVLFIFVAMAYREQTYLQEEGPAV